MRSSLIVAIPLLAAAPLGAQTWVQVTAGATYSSAIVDDGVLNIRLKPEIAPTFGVALSQTTGKGGYRVVLAADYSRSGLTTTGDGGTDHLAAVAEFELRAMLEAPIRGGLRARVGGGALFYSPSQHQGVFLDGGERRWILAADLLWSRSMGHGLNLLIDGRASSHEFNTTVLRDRGYGGGQGVERFGLHVGVERKL